MSTILLSIKPEYAKKIIDGTKKYEFRKRLAKHPVTKETLINVSLAKIFKK